MALGEVGRLFEAAKKALYTMARRKQMPAFEIRGRQHFRRRDAGRWIERQQNQRAGEAPRGNFQ